MLFTDTKIRSTSVNGWDLVFFEARGPDGTYLCTTAELSLDGQRKARLSLVRPHLLPEDVVAQLMERAASWIADYESRPHTGETGFGDL